MSERMTANEYRQYLERRHGKKVSVDRGWSGSEKRYFHGVLHDQGEYEGETIRITPEDMERHEYTPDFVTLAECTVRSGELHADAVRKVYHEVKGNYRLQSQDAARLRWCFAAKAHPEAIFVWAKEMPNNWAWQVEVWFDGGRTRLKERNVIDFRINKNGGIVWHKKEKQARPSLV